MDQQSSSLHSQDRKEETRGYRNPFKDVPLAKVRASSELTWVKTGVKETTQVTSERAKHLSQRSRENGPSHSEVKQKGPTVAKGKEGRSDYPHTHSLRVSCILKEGGGFKVSTVLKIINTEREK